jgi:hypothetical protein
VTDLISAPTDPRVVVASPQRGIELLSQSSVLTTHFMERVAMSRELRGL